MERAAPSVSKGSRVLWSEHQGCFRGAGMPRGVAATSFHPLGPAGGGSGASQVALVVKNPPANAGDTGDVDSIPGVGRSPGGGHGNPL